MCLEMTVNAGVSVISLSRKLLKQGCPTKQENPASHHDSLKKRRKFTFQDNNPKHKAKVSK